MSIPFFASIPEKPLRISERELKDAINGIFRFDRDKFVALVRSCPCGTPEVREELITYIIEQATESDDGSINVFKSGYAMGHFLRKYPNLEMVSDWIRDLNRLPIYRKQKENDE